MLSVSGRLAEAADIRPALSRAPNEESDPMAKFKDQSGVEFDTPIGQPPASDTRVVTADGQTGVWIGGQVHKDEKK